MDQIQYAKDLCEGYRSNLDRYELSKPKILGKRTKVVSISDLHIPFQRDDLVKDIIKKHSGADALVINGDLFDSFIISTFTKCKEVPFAVEYAAAMATVRYAAQHFKEVILIEGNHDNGRYYREINKLNPSLAFLVKQSPLQLIAKGEQFSPEGNEIGRLNLPNVKYAGEKGASWWYKIGKTIFCHRSRGFKRGPMANAVFMADHFLRRGIDFQCLVSSHCFDEETEILTNNGWRTIDSIQQTDLAVTKNLETGFLEYNPIEYINIYNTNEKLIQFSNLDGLDIRVTPEHGMLFTSAHTTKDHIWKRITASELVKYHHFTIPVAGTENTIPDTIISDDRLRLLAWIVTEGSFEPNPLLHPNKNSAIRIYQSDRPNGYIEYITGILTRLGFNFSLKERTEMVRPQTPYRFRISTKDSGWVFDYLTKDKIFKQEFLQLLSLRQRNILIDELCKGDGSACGSNRWRAFYSFNKRLADQFQFLAMLSGLRTKISIKKNRNGFQKYEFQGYVVHISYRDVRTVLKEKISEIEYSGRTWCLTVPNGTLVARRSGVPFITQNSHHLGQIPYEGGRLVIDQGCLCLPMMYESDGGGMGSPADVGYAVVEMDANGNVDMDTSKAVYLGTYQEKK